jgi:prepilin-type N-terminal cleavage/methylation domain-containing protein
MRIPPENRPVLNRAGMTLLELMVVLSVLSVLSGIAITRLNTVGFKMDAAARTTHAAVQQAQRLALTRQFDVIVSFDRATRRVRIAEDANNDGAIAPDERVRWRALEDSARFEDPPQAVNGGGAVAIDGDNLRAVDGMPSITFRRSGSASSELEVYLGSKRDHPDDYRAVQVSRATGRVEWFKYVGGQWRPGGL